MTADYKINRDYLDSLINLMRVWGTERDYTCINMCVFERQRQFGVCAYIIITESRDFFF